MKPALSKRCFFVFLLFAALVVFGILNGLVLKLPAGTIIFIELGLLALIAVYISLFIYVPFKRMNEALKLFSEEQKRFHLSPAVCSQWTAFEQSIDQVMDRKFEIDAASKHAEFLALQNQINPHFLYNTLEAIRADALRAKLDTIAKTTEALADFFRYTITEVQNVLPLEDELNNVENYFTIQHYRFGDKLKMHVYFKNEDISVSKVRLPKLTLQPIVENAIYHGLEKKVSGGTIIIKIEITQSKLLINIIDNGVGIEAERLQTLNERLSIMETYLGEEDSQYRGIALRNVNSRIKLLFGADYGIHVFSTVGIGTDVRLTLPLLQSNE